MKLVALLITPVIANLIPPQLAPTLSANSNIDYSTWVLQTPAGDTYSSNNLVNGVANTWWYPGTGDYEGYDLFDVPSQGKPYGTTESVRTELRELLPTNNPTSGNRNAEWSKAGYHRLKTDVKVQSVGKITGANSRTAIGQVWSSSKMFELFYNHDAQSHSFSYRRPESPGGNTDINGIKIGYNVPFTVEYIVSSGVLEVYLDSAAYPRQRIYQVTMNQIGSNDVIYFKTGNYDQSTTVNSALDPLNNSNSVVGLKNIELEHNPIKGRLVMIDGSPVAGQEVAYTLDGGGVSQVHLTTISDNDGYYLIPNVPSNIAGEAAAVNITAPAISGLLVDKPLIKVPAVNTSTISGVRTGSNYQFTFRTNEQAGPIQLAPTTLEITKGNSFQFGAVTASSQIPASVTWQISGQQSAQTTISSAGLLTVDTTETASQITVQATRVDDSQYTASQVVIVNKLAGGVVAAPTLASKTSDSVTVNPMANLSNGQAVEFGINTTNSTPTAFQTDLTFAGLNPDTNYYLFARSKENNLYYHGSPSSALTVRTETAPLPPDPDQLGPLTVATVTNTSVELTPPTSEKELEYALSITDAIPAEYLSYQSSPLFTGLIPNTTYYFYARIKATDLAPAGSAVAVSATTLEKAAGATLNLVVAEKTDNSITIQPINAPGQTVQYGISSTNETPTEWQSSNIFTQLQPATTYYVFAKAEESESHFASTTVSLAVTTNELAAIEEPEDPETPNYEPIMMGAGAVGGGLVLLSIVTALFKRKKKH